MLILFDYFLPVASRSAKCFQGNCDYDLYEQFEETMPFETTLYVRSRSLREYESILMIENHMI